MANDYFLEAWHVAEHLVGPLVYDEPLADTRLLIQSVCHSSVW